MSTPSTLITEEETRALVAVIGRLIRAFLSFAAGEEGSSPFTEVDNNKESLHNIEPDIRQAAVRFREDPDFFSDERLTAYGDNHEQAVAHPVRIEVRRVAGEPGVAQIAARGIFGPFRNVLLEEIRRSGDIRCEDYYLRLSGKASFEINRAGVNKALPLRYLSQNWDDVLDLTGYTGGAELDARKTRTVIAADGDGTTWDSPRDGQAPALDTSAAYEPLKEYLAGGGLFLIISGNHLDRTVQRVGDHIPPASKRNLLISANGGANLVYFDAQGRPQESEAYRNGALAGDPEQAVALDVVYLGDDGRSTGNDREAFETVGPQRSILVADPAPADIIPFLINRKIGGWVDGTRRVLEWVNRQIRQHPQQEIFTPANLDEMIRRAAQA